jgi:hypothetical protein
MLQENQNYNNNYDNDEINLDDIDIDALISKSFKNGFDDDLDDLDF